MNLRVEDGVSERAQHWNGDTKGIPIIYAEYFPPTICRSELHWPELGQLGDRGQEDERADPHLL